MTTATKQHGARRKLLHGPYQPPALSKGDRALCLLRAFTVVVTGRTDAPSRQVPVKALGQPVQALPGLSKALKAAGQQGVVKVSAALAGVVPRGAADLAQGGAKVVSRLPHPFRG
jgi:hypothetical protein